MAIIPTIQHNALVASLLGPNRYGEDVYIGVYNWAYYDYTFSLDNKDAGFLGYTELSPGLLFSIKAKQTGYEKVFY